MKRRISLFWFIGPTLLILFRVCVTTLRLDGHDVSTSVLPVRPKLQPLDIVHQAHHVAPFANAFTDPPMHPRKIRLHTCLDTLHNDTWNLPKVPQLIIAGAQKTGTSALRALLVKNPKIVASQQFEPHFFDSQLFRYLQRTYQEGADFQNELKPEWLCSVRRHYMESTFSKQVLNEAVDSDLLFFEKTPSYLLDPNIPQLIQQICPWKPKVLVMLRDPIARAFSHWKMERERLRVKQDFDVYVRKEVEWMRQVGLTTAPILPTSTSSSEELAEGQFGVKKHPSKDSYRKILQNATWTFLQRGVYSRQLKYWLEYFPLGEALMVIFFEEFQAKPKEVYQRVLKWIDVEMGFELTAGDFEKAYQTRGVYRRKGMTHAPLSNGTATYLKKFFRPYNDELASMLGLENGVTLPWQ